MSTPQSIPHVPPRFRIRLGTVLTALGALVAIAVTIIILALTGANHTTVPNPATASQAAGGPPQHVHYAGPHQLRAPRNPQSGGTSPTAGAGNRAAHYSCLGVPQGCFR